MIINEENVVKDEVTNTNKVIVTGEIVSLTYSHYFRGENFYSLVLKVDRESKTSDMIPVILNKNLFIKKDLRKGSIITVKGSFRSFNMHDIDGKNHLILSVYAKEIENETVLLKNNIIKLDGYICKKPVYRTTPLGREIADVFLAVNRPYSYKTDYIPCICWGKTARNIIEKPVGTHILCSGRIQSRDYIKKIHDEEICMTAYEVSLNTINMFMGEKI